MRSLVVVLLACLASPVTGHAIMINPTPRTGTDGGGQGNKLQPFGDARNSNCGGANNGDPPPFNAALRQPTEAFTPGSSINVQWELTIPHDADNTDIGVRVAVHYSCDDSFNDNILVGCLDGDPGCDDQTNAGVYLNRKAAAPAGSPAGTTVGAIITLPPGKTSNYAVIQWVWQARSDGGYYVQCADIAIVDPPGTLPQYALLPPENPPPTGGDCQNNDAAAAEAAAAGGSVAAVIVVLCILGAVGYAVKSGKLKMPGMPSRGGGGGGGGGAAMTAVGGLPPGWTSTLDPSSGRTYYTSPTGATQWEPPAAGGMAPPAAPSLPAPAAPLPPGWQAAVDPGSGKTYYVNTITNQTAWEHPSGGRF